MSNHKSFTLIELLVVIAIIGVLSAIVITSISGAVTKSRIVRLQVFSDTIRAQLSDSLVSYWSFNEGTGVTAYDQWEGNNGTLGGDPEWKSGGECVSGKCLEFDGNNDYVDCGNDESLKFNNYNDFTVEMWVNPSEIKNSTLYFYGDGCSSGQWSVITMIQNSKWRWSVESGATDYTYHASSPLPTANEWHYYVNTKKENKLYLYINAQITIDEKLAPNFVNEKNHHFIGGSCAGYFHGLIDEVRIYNSAVSITQIQSQYLAGLDKLLSNGAISKSEYNQRIKELSKEIVIE